MTTMDGTTGSETTRHVVRLDRRSVATVQVTYLAGLGWFPSEAILERMMTPARVQLWRLPFPLEGGPFGSEAEAVASTIDQLTTDRLSYPRPAPTAR